MNKEEATRILSKELVKRKSQKFITNSAYQKQTLEKALFCYPVEHENPLDMRCYVKDINDMLGGDVDNFIKDYKKSIAYYCSKVEDANYVFMDHFENLSQTRSQYGAQYSYLFATDTFSFFALIGEKETEDIKNLFYKDVRPEVMQAMGVLKIRNFVDDYKSYKNLDTFFLEKFGLIIVKKLVNYTLTTPFDRDGETPIERLNECVGKVSEINERLKQLGLVCSVSSKEYRTTDLTGYIHKSSLLKIIEELGKVTDINKLKTTKTIDEYSDGFFNFVFTIPYEDQVIEANKFIIKSNPANFDYEQVLVKEYSGGKYFQEYFDCLNAERQKKVVGSLKSANIKNPEHNMFLWNKGFKDVDVDYMNVYKTDTQCFMDYFAGRTTDEKKAILKDIMESDFINDKIADWLNENYMDLLREVGFDG